MSLRIIDRTTETERVRTTRDGRQILSEGGRAGRRRSLSRVRAIILHQTSFESSDDERLDHVIANYVVKQDGTVLKLRNHDTLLNSIGNNMHAIDIEFIGDYPGTSDMRRVPLYNELIEDENRFQSYCRRINRRRRQRRRPPWQCRTRAFVTPPAAQIQAGRELIQLIKRESGGTINKLFAHDQFTNKNCPGPHIWYNVGRWSLNRLPGLSNSGSGARDIRLQWNQERYNLHIT